ncbi:hypothetical protein O3P69_020216 [Scylla paramamosain]|uniref:Mediator complex subunit Med12 LCEWAV-domain domain-containing protein n=1 Tax=Scylla paramamosain TaxID=85552 RepID=A0AAW0TLP0_SCYPA
MMAVASAEKRPLKRQKLGPPDVYPQDAKQKEDELDDVSVKQGFTHRPQIQDEYSSAQNTSITPAKVANYFNAILKKKAECNYCCTARKKWQIIIKAIMDKMTSAYQESKVAESKIKKRQQPDIAQEWTQTLTRLLREQLNKIAEIYLGNPSAATPPVGTPAGSSTPGGTMTSPASVTSTPSSTPAQPPQSSPHNPGLSGSSSGSTPASGTGQNTTAAQLTHVLRNWNYCLQLAHFMYQSEYLSRKLAHYSAVKLTQLCHDSGYSSPRPQSPVNPSSNGISVSAPASGSNQPAGSTVNPLMSTFQELLSCHQHRPVVQATSCFIQAITLDCPTAMVWNNAGEGKASSWLTGSPLDLLPCPPSDLPMPPRYNNQHIRAQLRVMEEHIRQRSRSAENRWSLDKYALNVAGSTINRVLGALDSLDRHCFDRRCGEHRALVVARLLEKRQNNLSQAENDMPDEKDSVTSNQMVTPGGCTFQGLLLKFLDTQAPVYDENALSVRSQEFGNLVLLFSELIRQDVFSHDTYMCTLISRGDLATGTPDLKADSSFGEKKEDGTDNIDDDLGKILQKIAVNTSLEESGSGGRGELGVEGKQRPPRHLVYAQHFPLPQDDAYMHEINQRYVLLYGVGKARDEARAAVKKLTKEISKLFSKKCSNDIAEGGKVKKSSRGEFNFENILSRFCALSYFDQHHITSTVAAQYQYVAHVLLAPHRAGVTSWGVPGSLTLTSTISLSSPASSAYLMPPPPVAFDS